MSQEMGFENIWVIRVYDDEPELKGLYASFEESINRIAKRFTPNNYGLVLIKYSNNLQECSFLLVYMRLNLPIGELEYWAKGCDPESMNKYKDFVLSKLEGF